MPTWCPKSTQISFFLSVKSLETTKVMQVTVTFVARKDAGSSSPATKS